MPRHLLTFVFSAFAAFCCGAQTPEYKAAQYSGAINRFYTLCFDTENMLWAGGPSNGLPYQLPNGTLLHRVDANLNLKTGRYFNAEPDIEYPAEICWDAGDRIIGCGNYQDGGFGTGFVFRFRPQTTPSQLLFIKKIEGGEVRLSGLIENTADTSLIVYGTSLAGGVQRGELFKLHRNTGTLRPAFPKRYTAAGQGLSFDAAILQEGRLYTAGASWLGGVLDGNSVTCIDAATGEPLWLNSTHIVGTHLKARDLVFTDEDNFDGGSLFVVSNSDNPQNPAQGSHIFLQKINLDGSLQWTQKIDLPDWTDEYAEEIALTKNGFLIYGRSRNPAQQGVFLLKTDYSGKPVWAKRILQGSETRLPDWPAQAQMLVRNEAIYLACNALVTSAPLSPPNVGLLFKLQLDGTLANCASVQPTPAVNLPVGNQGNVNFLLNEEASPLQVSNVTASVMGSGGTFSPGTICQQTGYVCNDFPDLTVRVDSTYCSPATGGLGASVRLCNVGKVPSQPVTYLSFYDSNPLTGPAKRVFTRFLVGTVDSNACKTLQIELTPAFQNNRRYYVLLGADSTVQTPVTLGNLPLSGGFAECAYTNNLDSFDLALPPDCFPTDCDPITFLRPLAGNQDNQSFSCITASGDGNLYLAGTRKGRTILAKMAPDSKILWARSFTVAPFNDVTLAEIIVDSEGMMVGSGRQGTNNSTRGIAFRYDPNADQMLWIRLFDSDRASGGGILEKNPGGNYLLNQVPRLPEFLVFNGEILELDRATGQIVPGFAKRYQHGYAEGFSKIIAHGGALYATGFVDSVVNNELARRMILAKLDPNTGAVIWSRMGHMEWERPAYFSGSNLLVDDDGNLLTMYFGSEETYRINLGDGYKTYNFLQKTTLDGEILWVKRYDFNSARALATLPDGYLVTTGTYLIKLDKNGNILKARRVTDPGSAFANISQGSNAVRRLGDHLFSIYVQVLKNNLNVNYQRTLLLKTDLDLELAYACNGYVPATEQDSFPAVLPAQYAAAQTLRPSPAVQQAPVPVFGPDTVFVQKALCPDCPDSLCADVRVRMDSLSCAPAGGIVANISVCNLGGAPVDTGFHLTFYDKNPLAGGAVALQSVFLQEKPAPGACVQAVVPLDAALLQQPQIFALAGVAGNEPTPVSLSGFPFVGGFEECDYTNNLDSFAVKKPDCGSGGGCADEETFIKKLGSRLDTDLAFSMCKTADGNLYLAGRKNPVDLFIAKMTPAGEVLWMRKIPAGAATNNLRISEIIEDSDGKIVFSATQGNTPTTYNTIAMRYDPAGDTLIWFKFVGAARPASTGILEKGPGGNFLLSTYIQVLSTGRVYTRIWEVGRNTGETVPGAIATDYEGSSIMRFERMLARQNSLYATGARQQSSGGPTRSILVKLDAGTGNGEWGVATTPDSTSSSQPDVLHTDLEFDGDFALMTGSGLRNAADPAQGVFAYLEKHAPDGSLLWLKRYDVSMRPEDVLILTDAYVIFGKIADNRWGLLKTDKDGNPLIFKTLNTSAASLGNTLLANRQGQIFGTPDHLFMADYGPMPDDPSAIWLLKTDHNFDLDNACDLLQTASVQATTMPAKSVLVSLTRKNFTPSIADAGVIYEKDSLQICGICPACPCCAPDLTARVDSITCSSTDGVIAHLSVCNLGETAPDTGFHLTFYDKNPLVGGAVALQSVFLEEKPAPGACMQLQLPWDAALLQQPQVFTLVGADGNVPTPISLSSFPFSNGYAECDYANNLDSFLVKKPDCAPDSCHPSTFWKIFGRQGNWINISALRAAPDGNLYMTGRQDDHLTIGKMAPDGQFLWTRSLTLTPLQRPLIAEIIVDSEGMIVGSGNLTAPNTGENKGVFAFRYDPAAHQVLWVRNFNAFRSTEGGILEKTPGGNFLLHYNITTLPGQIGAEILELDRTTGQIVPAFAKRYEYQYSQAFSNIVAHGGAIYATGYTIRKVGNSGFRRMMMAKLDASTGGMIWSRTGLTDWPQASDFIGGDLIVDDNSLITMYYGSETSNSAFGNLIKLYLQKTTLDGEVLWVKRYDLPAAPRELLAVSDGYIIFAGASERFILKTDKEGNLLTSKKLDSQTFFFAGFTDDERNQVERIGQYLYFAHNTARSNQSYGYTTLLKTDLNLEMDFDCDLDPYPVQASSVAFQPNIMAQQVVTESVPTQQTLSTTLGSDFVILHKSCPTCATQACTNLPDITAHVDSITCSLPQGAVAHISICNLGQVMPSAGLHLTFYSKNPLAVNAVRLQSVFLQEKPSPGQCLQTVLPLNAALLQSSKVYTLAGVDGNVQQVIDLGVFPFANGYAECNYANNLDSFATVLPPIQKLELGPDRIICQGQTIRLDAGSGYASYNWLNGDTTQTLSVSTTGTYIAEVTDACNRYQRDTVQVTVLPYPKRAVNIVLLPGDSVTVLGKTYFGTTTLTDTIPGLTGICDSLVTYNIRLDSLHCKRAESFLRAYEASTGRVLLVTSDSSVYLAGEGTKGTLLSRLDANGNLLWTRQIFDTAQAIVSIYALIEDSEGLLVGCGNRLTNGAPADRTFAFRYDPVANTVLWFKEITPPEVGRATSILEKEAGGDYLLCQFHLVYGIETVSTSEIWRLDRATGMLVGGKVWRYDSKVSILAAKMHQGALYATGSVEDASSPNGRYGVIRIDPNTGAIVWAQKTIGSNVGDRGRDLLVDTEGNIVTLTGGVGSFWLQKTSPNGNLLWWRKYEIVSPLDGPYVSIAIKLLKDGSYVVNSVANNLASGGAFRALAFLKIDQNGTVLWGKRVPEAVGAFSMGPQSLAVQGNDTYFTWLGTTSASSMISSTLFGKFDSNGNIGEGCTVEDLTATFITENATQVAVSLDVTNPVRTLKSPIIYPPVSVKLLPHTRCSKCISPCEPVAVTRTITFYPGDTIVIGGTAYTQPDTVVQNFTTSAGCDSVVTNILQLVITQLEVKCPTDLTVTLPPNETTTVVDYPLPTATTDCPDQTIALRLLQGLSVGGSFPQGKTLVCYEAANQCGIRDTCCFTVTAVIPEQPCDVKTPPGCVRYELLSIQLDALGQRRYRVRLTNNCASPLRFAYLQLPNGVLAAKPAHNATYNSPSGSAYAVRNPNASPFYSVRYESVVENLNNGKSDIFEYTLPQQSAPAYIRAASRLADGAYSEAHLNTFFCPVLPHQGAENRSADFPGSLLPGHLSVWPNPTDGTLFVNLNDWQGQTIRLQVLNAQGQTVLSQQVWAENGLLELALPANMVNGLYYLTVQPEGGERRAVRFVVER